MKGESSFFFFWPPPPPQSVMYRNTGGGGCVDGGVGCSFYGDWFKCTPTRGKVGVF